jgi:hypothetical protein
VCVLAVVTLVELAVGATLLSDGQPILFGLAMLAWLVPDARTGTGSQRTLARVGVAGAALLLVGALGTLVS